MRGAGRILLLLAVVVCARDNGLPGLQDGAVKSVAGDLCESKTINYITHTLPQQCLRTR